MKFLEAIKRRKKGVISKWEHIFHIYDSYFEKIQNRPLNLLEIGIAGGGSLFTWKEYFPNSTITGIDINPDCKKFEEENIKVFIGDQANANFLKEVNAKTGPYDIVVDDGGHMMNQQITSFKTLFPLLNDGGFYVIEDWHTSYWPSYFDNGGKTIDFLKGLIDGLNFWAMEKIEVTENGKTKTVIIKRKQSSFAEIISSIHFYNAIVFIQKGQVPLKMQEVSI